MSSAGDSSEMSVPEKKEKPPERESSQSVTDVSRFPLEDDDSNDKYDWGSGGGGVGGGTVYRICLLGNMFEAYYAVLGFVAVVTGMLWAIHYAVSNNRGESDEDEFGTDIDNPENTPTKEERHPEETGNKIFDETGDNKTSEKSTSLPSRSESTSKTGKVQRRLLSDTESTQSSVDDFTDAIDIKPPVDDDQTDSYRSFESLDNKSSSDQGMEDQENVLFNDQAREIVDQAIEDAFVILENDDRKSTKENGETNIFGDSLEESEGDNNSDIEIDLSLDEVLDDAYALLDKQSSDTPPTDSAGKENQCDYVVEESPLAPVNENVNLSITSEEESKPQTYHLLEHVENHDDGNEISDQSEDKSRDDENITTVQKSIEYVTVESQDVPNAPVVKNAIDDDVVEDGSDETTTSSDADTVKDAGVDIKIREDDLERESGDEIENVVATLIANEMVNEANGIVDGRKEFDQENSEQIGNEVADDIANVVADDIANEMVNESEGENLSIERDVRKEHDGGDRTEISNVVADAIADEILNGTEDVTPSLEHDIRRKYDEEERNDIANLVAEPNAYDVVNDSVGDSQTTDHNFDPPESIHVINVVADRIANEIVEDTIYGRDVQTEAPREYVEEIVQPVESEDAECWLRNDQGIDNEVPRSDENYPNNSISVVNVVAESLADDMVEDIISDSAIENESPRAADDCELPQRFLNEGSRSNSVRRVSDGPIPQIRIDSVDDDHNEVLEPEDVFDEYASPRNDIANEDEITSALPVVSNDNAVPSENDISKDTSEISYCLPDSDVNQNETKSQTPKSIDVRVTVRHDDKPEGDSQKEQGVSVPLVVAVKTSHEDPTDVKDLLTKLTGEDIPVNVTDDEGEVDFDPKISMADFMATIGSKTEDNCEDVNVPLVSDQEPVVHELVASAPVQTVECSSLETFYSRPQESDNYFDVPAQASSHVSPVKDTDVDVQLTGSVWDEGDIENEQHVEAQSLPNQGSDDQYVSVQANIPSLNLRDIMSSLGGEDYNDVEEVEDNDDDFGHLKIEDFLLADAKMQPSIIAEDSLKHSYDGEPICEDDVMPEPVSANDSKDIDYFSNINDSKDNHDKGYTPDHGNDENQKSITEDDVLVVPLHVAAAEAGPDLDISSILSNVPHATPSNIKRRKEDDVVPTDVRKTVNGHVNLKSLLKSLGGDLSVDVDLDDSDVGETSPHRKKIITDEMVREAIKFLLQKPFLYSYGMYDSQDSLFYNAVFDDSLYSGGRTFALVSNLHGKGLTPEKQSTVFALVSSPSKENLVDDGDDHSAISEHIWPEKQVVEESEMNFDELFASLERRPTSKALSESLPGQTEEEDYIAKKREVLEEAAPVDFPVKPIRVIDRYPEVEDASPERLGPDSISPSDDDSSSCSSSDTSGTYILDNQMGLVEEDEEEEEASQFKQPSYPRDKSHDLQTVPPKLPGYHGYDHVPYEDMAEEDEEQEEEMEKPQTSRMFFITSAMLAQMSEEQNGESSSDNDYERRRLQSESPASNSSEEYLEPIPAGYGPNSERGRPKGRNAMQYPQTSPKNELRRAYPDEVPTAEYDYENETTFRPISGGESSLEPTPRFPSSEKRKDNGEIKHPSQNGHHVFSDYDSSSELLEIERQGQKLYPSSPHDYDPALQNIENISNGDQLPDQLLPAKEPIITMNVKYPDETAPTHIKDLLQGSELSNGQKDFKPIHEPTIIRDMNVPEQVQPVFSLPEFNQALPADNLQTKSYESPESYPTPGEPSAAPAAYAKTNGHPEHFSQSEVSVLSPSDYRGYAGSSEGEFDYETDTSFASGERMFALVGLRGTPLPPPPALSVTASIEVYRTEENVETQRSLYSYEINKGVAGPDGKIAKLQEQSFTFERSSDIVIETTESRFETVTTDSISDSAAEPVSWVEGKNGNSAFQGDHLFVADNRSDKVDEKVDDSVDSAGEGFSLNETVTADFTGEQFAQQPQVHVSHQGPSIDYKDEDFKLDLPLDSAGEEMSEREGLQRQVESLSELLSERTLDMQRFRDDYPFLDRIMADPKASVKGFDEGQLIGLLETYRQIEEDVLELMNIYKETKNQLAELEQMERG